MGTRGEKREEEGERLGVQSGVSEALGRREDGGHREDGVACAALDTAKKRRVAWE